MSFPMFNPAAFSQMAGPQAPTGYAPQQPRQQGPSGFAPLQQMTNAVRRPIAPGQIQNMVNQQAQMPAPPGGYAAMAHPSGAQVPTAWQGFGQQQMANPHQALAMTNLLEEYRRRQALMAHFAALRNGGMMGGMLGGGGGMGAVGGAVNGMFGGF